ncbi:hypothetical protein [Micromonospora sp. URMC 103]|uniref:hypothetical protein n=1 Tax=Micromonospora sp. URMC 103 TaxID=3423406 RepID=UPI003F19630E
MTSSAGRLSPAQREDVVRRAAAGDSLTEIANSYGVTRQAVRGLLRRRGVPARVIGKLTETQRSELIQQYLNGMTIGQLSTVYEVTEPAVRGLLLRRGVALRRVIRTLRHDAFDRLTPDACYWIGFLFADGCISYRPGHIPQISVALAERDRQHLVSLRDFLGSTSKISETSPTHKSCQFSVRSLRLADRLTGMGRYEGPIDERLRGSRNFWRGVVDGDGSIGSYKRSASSSRTTPQFRLVGSRRLLDEFVRFIDLHELARLSVRPHKTIHTVGTTGRPARAIVSLLYTNATTALRRKAKIAEWILADERAVSR